METRSLLHQVPQLNKPIKNLATMKKLSLMIMLVSSMISQLSAQCPNYSRPGVHVVQSGENLYRISKKNIMYLRLN